MLIGHGHADFGIGWVAMLRTLFNPDNLISLAVRRDILIELDELKNVRTLLVKMIDLKSRLLYVCIWNVNLPKKN